MFCSSDEFEKIIIELQNRNFHKVIEYVMQHHQKGIRDSRLEIIHAYCLMQLKKFIAAAEIKLPSNVDRKYNFLLKNIYIGLNQIDNLKKLGFENPLERYEIALLSYDFEKCINLSMLLHQNKRDFLIFSIVAQMIFDNETKHADTLKDVVPKNNNGTSFLYYLVKHNILKDTIYETMHLTKERNLCFYLILKEFFLDGRDISTCIEIESTDKNTVVNYLLDNLDDWDLYDYALREKLVLKRRNTLNYLYYRLYYDRTEESLLELLPKITNIFDLETINAVVPIKNLKSYFDFNVDDLISCFHNEPTLINLKLLLSVLIGSRMENLIVLALYFTYKYKNNEDYGYEIQLIHIFICRYFLYLPEVSMEMHNLRVQEIQKVNLSFLFHDVSVFYGIRCDNINNMIMENIKTINESLLVFVKSGKLDAALSLLHLRKKFENHTVFKEIQQNKILCDTTSNMFSNILGSRCVYFFSKFAGQQHAPGILKNIFNTRNIDNDYKKLLENDFYDLRDEQEFSDVLYKIVCYQENITTHNHNGQKD